MVRRIIVGLSGASGAPLALELLRALAAMPDVETHGVITRGGALTLAQELGADAGLVESLVDVLHPVDALGAAIASGSFKTEGMVVVPCSMKTVAGIVSGYSNNLLLRAADVCLKERRKLVLVARESPLSTVHLRNLYEASKLGAVVLPPMMAYYSHPRSVEAMGRLVVERILDQLGLACGGYEWTGVESAPSA